MCRLILVFERCQLYMVIVGIPENQLKSAEIQYFLFLKILVIIVDYIRIGNANYKSVIFEKKTAWTICLGKNF